MLEEVTEIKQRLIKAVTAFVLVSIPFMLYAQDLFYWYSSNLQQQNFIATEVTSPFTVPLKLALYLSLLVTMPYSIYQIWSFIAPALYKKEKKTIISITTLSVTLFYAGVAFAYLVVSPVAIDFFNALAPANVKVSTDINHYFNFVLNFSLVFALAFQTPLLVLLSIKFKLLDKNTIKEKRRYVIVIAFILGMLLTPPDVVSQVMLAIPLILLFELGLLLAAIL